MKDIKEKVRDQSPKIRNPASRLPKELVRSAMLETKGVQDTHSGGSGCGCSAVTLCGYILPKLRSGEWKRVLFVPTGALLSQISFNEGQNVPGIAHAVMLEHIGA